MLLDYCISYIVTFTILDLFYTFIYIYFFFYLQNAYVEYKEIKAAQGVKIAAKDLDKAIAGNGFFMK